MQFTLDSNDNYKKFSYRTATDSSEFDAVGFGRYTALLLLWVQGDTGVMLISTAN